MPKPPAKSTKTGVPHPSSQGEVAKRKADVQKTGVPHPSAKAEGAKTTPAWLTSTTGKLERDLVAKYGESQRERARRGLKQVAEFWRTEDGDSKAFEDFVNTNFAGTQQDIDTLFNRYEYLLEKLNGHMTEINREFRQHNDLDDGPIMPYDEIFAGYSPSAHITDDFFQNKLAFIALLNFPITSLDQRLAEGPNWTRRQWAETRLAEAFSKRIPADVSLELAKAASEGDTYISQYNIWMHHVVDDHGTRLFPEKLRLLSHWNLRDEIKADYADEQNGLAKQRAIQKVMERIVTQTIPAAVIDNPNLDWDPFTNDVKPTAAKDGEVPGKDKIAASNAPEPDTRYAVLLKSFQASRKVDPYSPTAPSLIERRFNEDRQLPEDRVRKMLVDVITSPEVPKVAALIQKRLGRPLEPFDIWYNGFRPRGKFTEAQLDEIVGKKYPTPESYRKDIPNLLVYFGWPRERAEEIARMIVVDPARGSGHAMGSGMKGMPAHLRTRVPAGGMNYKGFNIAIHEMGHNVEQTISMNNVDHYLLNGVPNTAFTEALAFVFQGHDLEQLGLPKPTEQEEALRTLNDFWGTYEIAGVALVDMAVWHWMYDHPQATPAQLKEATLKISRDTWNQYYAPVFHQKDVTLLAVYSHMIDSFLYLPDYPIGHLIAFQVEEQMRKAQSQPAANGQQATIGSEFERVARFGNLAPDLWMKNATGAPVGPEALLQATERAITQVQ